MSHDFYTEYKKYLYRKLFTKEQVAVIESDPYCSKTFIQHMKDFPKVYNGEEQTVTNRFKFYTRSGSIQLIRFDGEIIEYKRLGRTELDFAIMVSDIVSRGEGIPYFPSYGRAVEKIRANAKKDNFANNYGSITSDTRYTGTFAQEYTILTDKQDYTLRTDGNQTFNTNISNKETNMKSSNINRTLDTVKYQNVEAAKLAAKLKVGKIANDYAVSQLSAMFPWYAKQAKEAVQSPLVRLLTAELINGAAQYIDESTDIKHLDKVGDAMLQEAMVDALVYEETIENLAKGLMKEVNDKGLLDKITGK